MAEELKLKVGELTERGDFGRGIVRISAKDMKRLNIVEGDVVEIEVEAGHSRGDRGLVDLQGD